MASVCGDLRKAICISALGCNSGGKAYTNRSSSQNIAKGKSA
jgi:hypothetical protein